jgi:hypothetical protein
VVVVVVSLVYARCKASSTGYHALRDWRRRGAAVAQVASCPAGQLASWQQPPIKLYGAHRDHEVGHYHQVAPLSLSFPKAG